VIANYWSNLTERERWIAGIGAVCVLIYLFYLLIYSPLSNSVDEKNKQLIEKRETLAWMEQVRQQPKNQKKAEALSNTKLLALIGNQLSDKTFRPFPYQLQQTGPGDIQLSFDRVPYKQFLSWLWSLNNDYRISLKQFTADRTDTPGVVKLLIVITAK
jgi:general secretion pathway protein M